MQRSYGSGSSTSDTDIEGSRPLRAFVRNGATVRAKTFCSSLHRRFRQCSYVWPARLQTVVACAISNKCMCSCQKIYHQYFFVSKALYLVLLLNALFSTALYGVTSEVLKVILGAEFVLTKNLLNHGITQILFPVAGHVADTYIGRHNIIRFSLWLAWVGFAIMCISFSLDSFDDDISMTNRFAILPVSFALLTISNVCFMSNIIPFGMDQLQGASHVHYRSFFYWWYWTLNVGVLIVNIPHYCRGKVEMSVTIQAGIGITCVSTALILDVLLKHWFVIEPCSLKSNPLQQIVKILRHTLTAPKTQRVPSAVRHELDMGHLSRLDLAKSRYGGKYETEEVEDVRTFFRMVVVLCSVGFPVFSYAGVFGTIGLLEAHMNSTIASIDFKSGICGVELILTDSISALLLITFIPILDLLVVPFLRHLNPSILKRLGMGATLAFLSMLTVFLLETFGRHTPGDRACMFNMEESAEGNILEVNVYWVVLPLAVVTLAQICICVPGFEFICAQSPYNMRGLLVGLFFSIQGTFSLLAILLQYVFSWHPVYSYPFQGKTGLSCAFWYYLIFVFISFLGLLLYFLAAYKYKPRQRDNIFNTTVTLVEGYFASGTAGLISYD